jgi:hypothetical protein
MMNLLIIFLIQIHPFIIQGHFIDARTKNFKCYFLNFDKNKNILVSKKELLHHEIGDTIYIKNGKIIRKVSFNVLRKDEQLAKYIKNIK